ncbi:MAG: hypothetical protein ABIO83_00985 [Ilumatobacteraceae bacterium]
MSPSATTSITSWFTGRLPSEWTAVSPASMVVDRDEITITLSIPSPPMPADGAEVDADEAVSGRIAGFRDDTRERRMAVAREAEHRFERKVAWAVTCGDRTERFTNLAAPVMTRLRQPERLVLDTLIDASVARSRADALAWCVRLVGTNVDEWLSELRDALHSVEQVRSSGPDLS